MTDNIIPKKDAIDRMRDGLPCETQWRGEWRATDWPDFGTCTLFRIPPEPRREARSWNIYREGWDGPNVEKHETIHVREVLPDEVTLQMLGRDDARLELYKAIHAIEFGNKTDDKLIIAQLADQGVYLCRKLKEDK